MSYRWIHLLFLSPKDFKALWAGEIKWSNRSFSNDKELKNLLSFCQKNNLTDAIVTTIDIADRKIIDGISINFIPASVYAYNVGAATIAHQYQKIME